MSANNSDTGTSQLDANAAVSTFISALIYNAAVAAAVFAAFCIVRRWNKRIYQPRTYLVNEDVRSPELSPGVFSWITASFTVKDTVLVERIGLDAYMFLRFLRMSALLFAGFTLLAIPILIPLNVINGNGGTGLKATTIGNVIQSWRLWFHLVLTVVFCGATIGMLWREMSEYIRRRHAYLLSEKYARTPQSTTILVTGIPYELNSEDALYNIFNHFPGGVRSIWLNKNPKTLIKLCAERDEVSLKLEMAEYNYIRSAYTKSKKETGIKEPVRPFGRISKIPFQGPKVDLIEYYSNRLSELNKEIDHQQQTGTPSTENSAFIQFHTQFAAQAAVQTVVHPTPFQMSPMFSDISPLDVVWENMNLTALTRKARTLISLTAATALALFWFIPVVFVSGIASIGALVAYLPFLSFLNKLPPSITGIIQGILPPLFLAILMAILPIVLTMMSKFEGHVRNSAITLAVMKKYFFFLVVNVLLVSTIAGGLIKTAADVKDKQFSPIAIISIAATQLPLASTFFLTYALLQGLTGPVMELLQIAPLVLNLVFTKLLAKSPRQIWNVQGRLSSVNFGNVFPPVIIMFCVGILYSTIAPLILPFVTVYFTFFYFVYRHQFLYIYEQPVETGGLAFPLAVKQTFTGIFVFEITVFGIFLLQLSRVMVIPHLVILAALIGATVLAYINMNQAFDPLVTFLPVALFSKDLHLDQNGVVRNRSHKDTSKVQDEEIALGEKGSSSSVVALGQYPKLQDHHHHQQQQQQPFSEKSSMGGQYLTPAGSGGKQEYDEVAEVSSQLPAIPTPNPSVVDSIHYHQMSLHPSVRQPVERTESGRDRPVSFRAPSHHSIDAADELSHHREEDPVLRRLQEQAYCHPAVYNRQRPIWLPMDERGIVTEEISRLASMGIVVATTGAALDPTTAKASVGGIVFAPGEEERYRLERGV
ncbi:hypothetical protein EDD11_000616 [Mortierella claussenii]|nr:hypothetical protein EDD11_000616 [Mortierella claussenii]